MTELSKELSSLGEAVSWYGSGHIAKIDETLDAQLYIEILKEDLKMSVDEWELAKDKFIFQLDKDPKHTAKVTKAYVESVELLATSTTTEKEDDQPEHVLPVVSMSERGIVPLPAVPDPLPTTRAYDNAVLYSCKQVHASENERKRTLDMIRALEL
ncbi:hypothetical protein BGZ58_004385 [Dissophora ornata]|nr:hypothetical protein BGZ58_004385 [Dissophora ornata]